MKKFLSMILALAMVFSLAMPAMAVEITGDSNTDKPDEGNVTATFVPEIYLSGISITGDTVTYDSETNTYITVFPVGAESITHYTVFNGKNLAYYRDTADRILFRDVGFRNGEQVGQWDYILSDYNYFTYDEATGNLTMTAQPVAAAAGETWVRSYSNDGGRTWQEAYTLVFAQAYSITNSTAADANGSVTVPASAIEGETVNLTVTPAEGYELDALTVTNTATGAAVTVNEDHTFTMPAGNVTVTATFQQATKTYTVTVDENIANGTVVVNPTTYTAGQNVALAVTPADGYVLDQLTVTNTATGEPVNVLEDYSFTMPEGDVTVTAVFEKVYNVTPSTEGAGTVHVDKEFAAEGETVTVTFTANDGYVLFNQYAFDHNNSSDYVELIPGTDANTYTFTMPPHDVLVQGVFTKDGKAREDLYFNNGGNTDWTNVFAYFYTDTGSFIASVSLTMAENGVYTIPKDQEIPNLAYKVYFDCVSGMTEIVDIPTGEANMFTLGTTTDEYGRYEGTWSVYTPSTPAVTSADISWGSLAFTYSDETNAWSNDGSEKAGTVTVKNTGNTTVTVNVSYSQETGYEEITGAFDIGGTLLESEKSMTYTLTLSGQPKKALHGEKIGTVTVKIGSAAAAE